jgi:hypothetical protein
MGRVKIMKIYKDTNNNLWAYEEDGSQDHLIPVEFILINDEEAEAIRLFQIPEPITITQPTIEELMAQLNVIQEQIKTLGAV